VGAVCLKQKIAENSQLVSNFEKIKNSIAFFYFYTSVAFVCYRPASQNLSNYYTS